jgi:hypothetical protein
VMEQKMLRNIRHLAERAHPETTGSFTRDG